MVVDAALHIADHVPFSDDASWDISRFEPAYGVGWILETKGVCEM